MLHFRTRVYHQLAVERGLPREEAVKRILEYLRGYTRETGERVRGYEDAYPETATDEVVEA